MRPSLSAAEAAYQTLVQFVTEELHDNVDYRTGEILDRREYVAGPWACRPGKAPVSFAELRSHRHAQTFLERRDGRSLRLWNGVRGVYDHDKGQYHLHGGTIRLTNTRYQRLQALVERLDYQHLILADVEALAADLGVRRDNLYRYLASLDGLVEVTGARQGMQPGTIRVAISPAYGYRYEASQLHVRRRQAIDAWYRSRPQPQSLRYCNNPLIR